MFDNSNDREDKPGIEEIYERATNASNLKQEAERRTAADVLRDMAMSADRIGAALLRLRGQWEASEKPTRQATRSVKQWAEILPFVQEGTRMVKGVETPVMVPDKAGAQQANEEERARHDAWYQLEMERLVGQLAALPEVRDQLTLQALKWNMGRSADPITRSDLTQRREHDAAVLARYRERVETAADDVARLLAQAELNSVVIDAEKQRQAERNEEIDRARSKATAVIRYWLDQTCQACDGRKWQLIPGSPSLSNKMCRVCQGTGVAQVPHGQDGRKLANHMDQCVHRYRQTMRTRKAMNSQPLSERIPMAMRHGRNPKAPGADPEAD